MASWTKDYDDRLISMWKRGMTGSQIGLKLGRSRCSVLGRAMRLGLMRTRRAERTSKVNVGSIKARKPVKAALPPKVLRTQPDMVHERIVEDVVIPEAERMHLLVRDYRGRICANEKFDASCCRWPIGDPKNPDFHFCNRKRFEGLPYCEAHARRAYPAFAVTSVKFVDESAEPEKVSIHETV